MLEEADRLGLPIIGLPDGVSFDDVINQVLTEVLNRQAAVLARSEEAHQALVQIVLTGGGLDRLCEELVGICGGVAMVTTPDGRVLASAGGLEQVEDLGCFDGSGRFIVEAEPVGSRPAGGPASTRVVVRIVAGSLDHGRLVAFSSEREMSDDDVHLLEGAATVAALAITKAQAVSAVESKYQADFLRDALAGRAGSAERVTGHADSLGWDIGRPMVVVVAETDPNETPSTLTRDELRSAQERFATAWARTVQVRDPKAPVVGFSQEVVAVLGVPDDADSETTTRMVRELARAVSGEGGGGRRSFSTGVSRRIDSADALPQAYEQARKAVAVGRQMHGASALMHFDGLGIFRLLSPGARHRRAAQLRQRGPRRAGDQRQRGERGPARHLAGAARHQLQRRRGGPDPALPLQHAALPHREAGADARPVHHGPQPAAHPGPGVAGRPDAGNLTPLHQRCQRNRPATVNKDPCLTYPVGLGFVQRAEWRDPRHPGGAM